MLVNLSTDWLTNTLLNNLELAGLHDDTVFIPELENVNAPEEIIEIDGNAGRGFFYFIYFFTHEIVDLQGVGTVIRLCELKRDGWAGGIWIEIDKFCGRTIIGERYFILGNSCTIYSNK